MLSAYFNLDNGSGRIRGVYAEGNAAARAIVEDWLEPFHDLGATHVTLNRTTGTDHESFQQVGLPGFQFIQDALDYDTRLHHSQLDLSDHVYEDNLKQASVIMASFLYHAACVTNACPGSLSRCRSRSSIPGCAPDGRESVGFIEGVRWLRRSTCLLGAVP